MTETDLVLKELSKIILIVLNMHLLHSIEPSEKSDVFRIHRDTTEQPSFRIPNH